MQAIGKRMWLKNPGLWLYLPNRQLAFAKVISLLTGFHETCPVPDNEFNPILHNREGRDTRRMFGTVGSDFIQADNDTVYQKALIALPCHQSQRFGEGTLFSKRDIESNQE